MRALEDLLQERLERLEKGELLEACLTDLPEEEASLLRLAAGLREVPYPERDRRVVAAQRAKLLKRASKEQDAKTRSPSPFLGGWLRPAPVLAAAAAMALLFACAFVTVLALVLSQRSPEDSQIAHHLVPSLTTTPGATLRPTSDAGLAQDTAPDTTQESPHTVYFPIMSEPANQDPQVAVLKEAQGIVQVQESDGGWTPVNTGHTIRAGQQVRTGELSGVVLAFLDGSQAHVGPDTEVSVDALDARPTGGPRVVALTQWKGETSHDVIPASAGGSRYEVRTPSATGVARGTSFHVLVLPDQLARFSVDEGTVAVSGQGVTVPVLAGQSTTVNAGQVPNDPAFRITGEGEVNEISVTWTIAGHVFATHDATIIVGNPQVGDWVFVEGHLLPDETRVADQIVLLHRSPVNHFTIKGPVDAIEGETWTIAGQAVEVSEETDVDDDVEIGDLVRVEGVILESGTLLAERIRLVDEKPGLPFEFVGVVQNIADESWTISGVPVAVDQETEIDEDLTVGDLVKVQGWILADGNWLAGSIKLAEELAREFEFTGEVQSITPWVVAGISFETREWTEIDSGIEVGERVKVKGRVLEDGTWVATEIKRLEQDDSALQLVFVGTVTGVDPWTVNGIPLVVGDETIIIGDVGVGDLVKVEVEIQPDGTWLATNITLVSDEEAGLGCLYVSAVVTSVSPDQIELLNWPTPVFLEGVAVEGEITVGSVVLLHVCVDADGTITVDRIIILYQPQPVILTPTPPSPPLPPPGDGDDDDEKVTICHKPNSKNPRTITISRSALQAHLDHGDTIGPCR